jgi:succinate dehydrogenase / fumarate reductase cytochrome b subunit
MPVSALTSIMHRVTGVLLALGIPFGVYLLDRSLQGPEASSAGETKRVRRLAAGPTRVSDLLRIPMLRSGSPPTQ